MTDPLSLELVCPLLVDLGLATSNLRNIYSNEAVGGIWPYPRDTEAAEAGWLQLSGVFERLTSPNSSVAYDILHECRRFKDQLPEPISNRPLSLEIVVPLFVDLATAALCLMNIYYDYDSKKCGPYPFTFDMATHDWSKLCEALNALTKQHSSKRYDILHACKKLLD